MRLRSEEQQRFIRTLDTIDGAVTGFYRVFLGLLAIAIVAGTVLVVVKRPFGAGHQGEWFYFSVAVVMALGWVMGEYFRIARRRAAREFPISWSVKTSDDARTWELRLGAGATPEREAADAPHQLEFSHTLEFPLAVLSRDRLPDDDAIAWMESAIGDGMSLDDAIRIVTPEFDGWNRFEQDACRRYVMHRLRELQSAAHA